MTQTPEPDPVNRERVTIKADCHKTEMGLMVTAHSKAVNITVEMDLDYAPEFTYGILQMMPEIIHDQMTQYAEENWVADE